MHDLILVFQLLFVTTLIIYLPFADSDDFVSGNQIAKSIFFIRFLFLCSVIFALSLLFNTIKRLKLNWLDIFLVVYFIYVTLNRHFIAGTTGLTIHYMEFLGLFIFYFIIRSFTERYFQALFVVIMISGIIQAIYGNLQLFGIYPSNHSYYHITGGFFNPGPYAGYLSGVFSIALGYYLFIKASDRQPLLKITKLIAVFAIVSIILVLPATRSRAAWLAVFFASLYLGLKYNVFAVFINYFSIRLKRTIFIITSIILLTGMLTGLYLLKKGSADGRLLIWKVTANMIADRPFFGHGYEKHKAYYMEYQAKYFVAHPEDKNTTVADNNQYAYNEALKTTSETGIIGITLALIILYFAFFGINNSNGPPNDREHLFIVQAGLISIIIFGMFSYPGDIIPIKLFSLVFLAALAQRMKPLFQMGLSAPRLVNLITKLSAICILSLSLMSYPVFKQYCNALTGWHEAFSIYNLGDYETSIEKYQGVSSLLNNEGVFLVNYGKALSMAGDHVKAIRILSEAKEHQSNSIIYTALGDSYKALFSYAEAEKAYMQAWHMAPAKFYPKYLLSTLFDETGQRQKAMDTANELLSKEVKIPSIAIEEIRTEMKKIIEKNAKKL